jgi:excisionase family DNA binding protein
MNGAAPPPEAAKISVEDVDPKKLYTVKFAADALDCSSSKIRKDATAGKIESVRNGAHVFIRGDELIRHMKEPAETASH